MSPTPLNSGTYAGVLPPKFQLGNVLKSKNGKTEYVVAEARLCGEDDDSGIGPTMVAIELIEKKDFIRQATQGPGPMKMSDRLSDAIGDVRLIDQMASDKSGNVTIYIAGEDMGSIDDDEGESTIDATTLVEAGTISDDLPDLAYALSTFREAAILGAGVNDNKGRTHVVQATVLHVVGDKTPTVKPFCMVTDNATTTPDTEGTWLTEKDITPAPQAASAQLRNWQQAVKQALS